MEIYVVSHYWDNGESYEDYREYEDHLYFSTLKKASSSFWKKVTDDYEGKFVLKVVKLDTQEQKILEESPWIQCTSHYYEEWQGEHEPEYDPEDCYPDPMKSYKDYWRHEDAFWYQEDNISEEEDKAWFEYVTTPGTNYQEWKECEEEIKKRKSDILFDELNSMLTDLLHV